jgi:uncharacterized membrane protein YecN with MAPEG domain
MIITSVAASILALIFVKLSMNVIALRRQNRVGLGFGGVEALERAIRAHGNFAEYVPLALILVATLEYNGAPRWLVAIPALMLIVGRVLHARGMQTPPPEFTQRVRGMMLTFASLVTLAVVYIVWILIKSLA